MTAILGISGYYHDSAAALLVDGTIVAAAQEERFTRIKHDAAFPRQAVAFCLKQAGLSAKELDFVAFYEKPLRKFERLLETYLAFAPAGFASFCAAMPGWLSEKLHLPREIRRELPGFERRIIFCEHHESHAASAFYPSPFPEAAVLTLDGVGEWHTGSFGVGEGRQLKLLHTMDFPHSLGLLYSAFTYFCGFKVNSGEYKLMGLAPYGEPRYVDLIQRHLLDIKPDGSFQLNLRYFNYCQGLTMTNEAFAELFGGPARPENAPLSQREMDLAASIQAVTEDIVLRIGRHVHAQTGARKLCLAGGVALNCVANGKLLREGPFEHVFIQPAAGDAGGALGAAFVVWHGLLGKERAPQGDAMLGARLGPGLDHQQTIELLHHEAARFHVFDERRRLVERVADLLASGAVVGWVQGRMEFGPRALGSRSILGDPRDPNMQSRMNLKIKFRESFRPFAPCVLEQHAHSWFELPEGQSSPYMLLVMPVSPQQRLDSVTDDSVQGLERLRTPRSRIPAVTHVDGSARVQTVDAERDPELHALLDAFHQQTGCPVLINTSFNVRGEPIVCSAHDAWRCFMATDMDALVIGDVLLLKEEQDPQRIASARAQHARFAGLD